ncbi:MAG: Gfo/Idh/MocA family oxidoreductase [Candidatus Hydrogenedentes bacterium]|nr:Gfo/Idh/MocA family oxidoreductase [Candidatus Hydrogenedentota bacterium]
MSDARRCETGADRLAEFAPPELPYLPRTLTRPAPGIALIGCGGIAAYHLAAYRAAGYPVLALYDVESARAEDLRDRFYPDARVTSRVEEAIHCPGVEVIDAATHPDPRVAIIEMALRAGKDVLSQKPLVTDLATGARLCDLAEAEGRLLAVNLNGRWAPHFSYMRQAIDAGLIGAVKAVTCSVHWDHNWTADTAFNTLPDLILYDFGIHWFDILWCFFHGRAPRSITACASVSPGQRAQPPLLASATVQFERGQAAVVFHGDTPYGGWDTTVVVGEKGTLISEGPDLNHQSVRLYTEAGVAFPKLSGDWFTNGFHGTMAELLYAREHGVTPHNNARSALESLAWCFSAREHARSGAL